MMVSLIPRSTEFKLIWGQLGNGYSFNRDGATSDGNEDVDGHNQGYLVQLKGEAIKRTSWITIVRFLFAFSRPLRLVLAFRAVFRGSFVKPVGNFQRIEFPSPAVPNRREPRRNHSVDRFRVLP
jgi:hypothetical protein